LCEQIFTIGHISIMVALIGPVVTVTLYSIQFILYSPTSQISICTHTITLSQDLTSDQEKLPKKLFHRVKKGKKSSAHSFIDSLCHEYESCVRISYTGYHYLLLSMLRYTSTLLRSSDSFSYLTFFNFFDKKQMERVSNTLLNS